MEETNDYKVYFRMFQEFLRSNSAISQRDLEWANWKERIEQILIDFNKDELEQVYKWCIESLKSNLEAHLKIPARSPDEFDGPQKPTKESLEDQKLVVTEGYGLRIRYFENRLESNKEKSSSTLNKISWLDSQKQLAELFIELKRKGWIAKFEYATIQTCFTQSHSIRDYLRPYTDKKTKEPTYEKVYFESDYIRQFGGIESNKKS